MKNTNDRPLSNVIASACIACRLLSFGYSLPLPHCPAALPQPVTSSPKGFFGVKAEGRKLTAALFRKMSRKAKKGSGNFVLGSAEKREDENSFTGKLTLTGNF